MIKKIVFGAALLVALILWSGISIYPDWLWFKNLAFSPVYWTMLLTKFGFGVVIWVLLMLAILINMYIVRRIKRETDGDTAFGRNVDRQSPFGLSSGTLNLLLFALVLIASLVIAAKGSQKWDMVLRYLYQEPFNQSDPIFGRDVGYYVFSLPLYLFIQNGLLILLVLSGGLAVVWYLKDGVLQVIDELAQAEGKTPSMPKISMAPRAKRHLIFLAGFAMVLIAWGFYLKVYGLLYSTQGPAFGASYTDVHFKVLAYRVLAIASLGLSGVLFVNAFKLRAKVLWISAGIWLGAVLMLGTVIPMIVQKLVVKPNELAKESPYIAYNIDATRQAYNLDKIKEVDFAVREDLRLDDLDQHHATIQNIRIWDERPLLQTYKQIQAIRLYYDFNNVDVDRYIKDGRYRQVMLAAREMVVSQLPTQAFTWVNRHLTYTHGYGLALSPVNEVTPEGLPRLFVKDLPPSFDADLKIDRPEIYYGEKTNEYVLVKTKNKEFDYPKGDKNIYTTYEGKGGVPVNSFFRRLLFAIEFLDSQILFTTYLGPESRIMYKRRIDRRVRALAPFLVYDRDPYLVLSEGKLYWMQDAYTTSNMYPYSKRSLGKFHKPLNYIRNSVKVTIDAYNGEVRFYVIDAHDPIVKTYERVFPDLFRPFDEMPAGLKKHIRYPRDLFEIQVGTYTTYHMEDVKVFYNQEDLWALPDELYGGGRQPMEPYYIIIKLPEGEKEEFLLMLPFTPSKKDNMIGWLAARCDLPDYGKMLVYKLPKEKLVYGPMQIEARVDQQTDISRELSLWGQKGSRVIRGNLLAIPVAGSFIYVEPVYLEAKQEEAEAPQQSSERPGLLGKPKKREGTAFSARTESRTIALPELKRVIAAYTNRVVMEETLDDALKRVLEDFIQRRKPFSVALPRGRDINSLATLALEHYNRAKEYMRQGRWGEYGKALENLESVLKEMARLKEKGN